MVGVYQIQIKQGLVYKHLKTDNEVGEKLWKRLKKPKNLSLFKNLVENLSHDKILGPHIVQGKCFSKRGNYYSPLIKGLRLSDLKCHLDLDIVDLVYLLLSLAVLLTALQQYQRHHGYLIGDWTLHNLIYQGTTGRIINIDLEGFYTYSPFGLDLSWNSGECRISTVKARLKTLQKQLVQLIFTRFNLKSNTPNPECLTLLDLPGQYQLIFPIYLACPFEKYKPYFNYLDFSPKQEGNTSLANNLQTYQVYLSWDNKEVYYLLVDAERTLQDLNLNNSQFRHFFRFSCPNHLLGHKFTYKTNPLRSKILKI